MGSDTRIDLSGSDSVLLGGVSVAALTADGFAFAVPPATFSVDDVSVAEGGIATFTISRGGDTSGTSVVSFATALAPGPGAGVCGGL